MKERVWGITDLGDIHFAIQEKKEGFIQSWRWDGVK